MEARKKVTLPFLYIEKGWRFDQWQVVTHNWRWNTSVCNPVPARGSHWFKRISCLVKSAWSAAAVAICYGTWYQYSAAVSARYWEHHELPSAANIYASRTPSSDRDRLWTWHRTIWSNGLSRAGHTCLTTCHTHPLWISTYIYVHFNLNPP